MADAASRVAAIVAAIDSRGDIAPVLARLVEETEGLGRVIVVDGSTDRQALRCLTWGDDPHPPFGHPLPLGEGIRSSTLSSWERVPEGQVRAVFADVELSDAQSLQRPNRPSELASKFFPEVQVIARRPGSLVPELWRDGLNATSEPLILFTTAQMIPARGWLAALLRCLENANAAAVGGPIEAADDLTAIDRAVSPRMSRRLGRPDRIGFLGSRRESRPPRAGRSAPLR